MNEFSQYPVPSSSKGSTKVYNVRHYHKLLAHNERWECACPNWTQNTPREDCKHILLVKLMLQTMSPDAVFIWLEQELAKKKDALKKEMAPGFGEHKAVLKAGYWRCKVCGHDKKQMENFPKCQKFKPQEANKFSEGFNKWETYVPWESMSSNSTLPTLPGKVFLMPLKKPALIPEPAIPEVSVQTLPTKTGRKFR